jgi:quercetin dioxygenase-like cupin family protein
MKSWQLGELKLKPRLPEILSSSDESRALALDLASGEKLSDHELHERAWIVVASGEIEVGTAAGAGARGGPGLVVELAPRERHEVRALQNSRLLLVLTPWPGRGHPGAMTLTQKLYARRHAAKQREGAPPNAA